MAIQDFRDRKCLITGAASGIGRAAATILSGLGSRLFLTDLREAPLREVVDEIQRAGGRVEHWAALDVSVHEEVERFAAAVHEAAGPMDIVMNVAGISIWGPVERLRREHWERVIGVDLLGPIYVIECFLPPMVRAGNGGHLVNVSSAAGLIALPWHAAYSAAKFGLVGVSEVLRYDLMPHRIGVSVICPGAVDTPLKHTVEILGVDREHPTFQGLLDRFSRHAVSPEKVARLMVEAVRKNRFLVVTSFDIWLAYWCKRKLFFAYHLAMRKINEIFRALTSRASV